MKEIYIISVLALPVFIFQIKVIIVGGALSLGAIDFLLVNMLYLIF